MKSCSPVLRTDKVQNWGIETEESTKFRQLSEWRMCFLVAWTTLCALHPLTLEGAQSSYTVGYCYRLRINLAESVSVVRFTCGIIEQNWKTHWAFWSCSIAKKQQTWVFSLPAFCSHNKCAMENITAKKNTFSCVLHRKEFMVEILKKKISSHNSGKNDWV